MEKQSGFQTKVIILEGGERFPLMLQRSTGLPVGPVTDWAITSLRGKPIATSKRKVASVALFYEWAEKRGIDLDARFQSLNLFSSDEVTGLSEHLYLNNSPSTPKNSRKSVVGAHHRARVDNVIEYIRSRASKFITSYDIGHPKVANANQRLGLIIGQLEELRGSSVSIPRGSLTEEQCKELFNIAQPGSPRNPFQERTQLRNYVILLLLYELGLRRAEPLTIKGRHVAIGRQNVIRITFTPNDPADHRVDTPSIKTKSRDLPISLELARSYELLLRQRRSNPKTMHGAKKTEFIFLSTNDGKPLSKKSLYEIFVILRENFPEIFPKDFAPHHLRRTWNYRFSKACEGAGIDANLADKIHRYFMGWSINSSQPSKYNEKFIAEMAMKIGLAMQNSLTGDGHE